MKKARLEQMTHGWFVGNFEPSLYKTNAVEVAVKRYSKGDDEEAHYHMVATEITVIVSGCVMMNGTVFSEGDILVIDPSESTDFRVLSDTVTVVVKIPGANNDKYLGRSI